MTETFTLTLMQMIMLFTFIVLGYIYRKAYPEVTGAGVVLSKLEVMIFLPALTLETFSKNCTIENFKSQLPMLITGIIIFAVIYAFSLVISRFFGKDPFSRGIYTYIFTFPNLGYIGYPLVLGVFGEMALFKFMIFAIPFNFGIYTLGIYHLNPNREFSLKKLLNPPMIFMFVGIAFGLLNIKMPEFFAKTLASASSCMAPVAMILTGFVLAGMPFKKMFINGKAYIATLFRLIIFPVTFGAILHIIGVSHEIILMTVIFLSMPTGLNTVVFPEAFGGDSTEGAQCAVISGIFGIITIPLMLLYSSIL